MSDDITSTHLDAAIIDQKVAGAFQGKTYAFIAVPADEGNGWELGVAVKDEPGYHPVEGVSWKDHDEAQRYADRLNQHIGLALPEALAIVASSMIAQRTAR